MIIRLHCFASYDCPGISRLKYFIKEINSKKLKCPINPLQTDPIIKEILKKEHENRLILVGISKGKQILYFTAVFPEKKQLTFCNFPTETFSLIKMVFEKLGKS